MIGSLLVLLAPGLLTVLVGVVAKVAVLRTAGAWACLIIAISTPATIAVWRNHSSTVRLLSGAAIAAGIRVSGLAIAVVMLHGRADASWAVVTIAGCLFACVLLETVCWFRSSAPEAPAHV